MRPVVVFAAKASDLIGAFVGPALSRCCEEYDYCYSGAVGYAVGNRYVEYLFFRTDWLHLLSGGAVASRLWY